MKKVINFGHERYYNDLGHKFVRPIGLVTYLGQSWKVALTNPYYILSWQVLLLLIIYDS